MINANELRIGNIVYPNGENATPYTVGAIVGGNEASFTVNSSEADDIQGIPLTGEWLLKMGFDECHAEDIDDYENGPFALRKTESGKWQPIWKHTNEGWMLLKQVEVNYVHQLQNLFFALTGEELTLK